MKKYCSPLVSALVIAAHVPGQAEPLVNSWYTQDTGVYARIYETTAEETAGPSAAVTTWSRGMVSQSLPTYVGVNGVSYTETDVYVRSTGLGAHIMGPWYLNAAKTNLFPGVPGNQAVIYRIPLDPGDVPMSKSPVGLGRIGMFVDGVSMFSSSDSFSYDTSAAQDDGAVADMSIVGDGVWNRDAYVNEGVTFDAANAHQAGSNYHYHADPPALRNKLGDSVDHDVDTNSYTENFNGAHSPILGWVADGYPIYGPYGYTDALDPSSAVTLLRSGYQKRTITQRQVLPAHSARVQGYTADDSTAEYSLAAGQYGPDVTGGAGSQYELGHYIEDYEYLGDLGQVHGVDFDLDLYNGRFCVTPEFPDGTYAYFVCVEADGTPKFPYLIGWNYYGEPQATEVNSIPGSATIAFEGGPKKEFEATGLVLDSESDQVTVTWSAVQGGAYDVERSSDLDDWELLADASLDADVLSLVDSSDHERMFYRSTLTDVAEFDDAGFDLTEDSGDGGNNVLLIIVDDWGIDSSPIDNPTADRNASMPNLQWLSDNGLRFTNAYAQAQCSPTRATMLTGRYAFRNTAGTPAGANLPASEFTLPEAFTAAGSSYALASYGKWHLGGGSNGPSARGGWSEFAGTLTSGVSDYWDWDKTTNGTTAAVTNTYATTEQVDDTIQFVDSQGDNPWFCWLAFNAPHSPFHDPDASLLPSGVSGTTPRDRYEKALEAMDTEIGRLLESIDLTTTNVLLIGDNGTPGNVVQSPFGPGNAKGTLYEGGIRVPFVAIGPDITASGTNDDLIHCADIYSTILALAGIDEGTTVPAGTVLDSRSLLPAFEGGNVDGSVVLESFGNGVQNPGRAIRQGDYKLIVFDDPDDTTDTPTFEFYDVVTDPSENSNLLDGALSPEEQGAYDAAIDTNAALGGEFG